MGLFSALIHAANFHTPKRYGWKADANDGRDFLYGAMASRPHILPKSVDLRPSMPSVYDQGELGSCTGNAICGAKQYGEMKDSKDSTELSRLFVYFNERTMEGTVNQDAGAMTRDGAKSLNTFGVCSALLCPYDISKFTVKPSDAAYADAVSRKVTSYHRIQTLQEMKQCLAESYPFVFGFTVYEGFESAAVANSGVVNLPKRSEKVIGGHAVLCVGYDDASKRVIVRNSWGDSWGQKGYFTMPYDYIANTQLASDMWTLR